MRIVVIGAGAAGLVAAAEASNRGADVILLEKNNKTGVKILMSGGTRCNLTHHTDAQGITHAFGEARRFLQPSVGSFPPQSVIEMFTRLGVVTKIESTGKIFPKSDRALEVRDALHRQAIDSGTTIRLRSGVKDLQQTERKWQVVTGDDVIDADRVIVTAGGMSWPGCGTTGDAYDWLRRLGHTIVRPRPALVPLVGGHDWTHQLSGVTIADCMASVKPLADRQAGNPAVAKRRSSLLFTHFGFSGPAAMDVSRAITLTDKEGGSDDATVASLSIDLLPGMDTIMLQHALLDRGKESGRRKIAAVLGQWLPKRLVDALVAQVSEPGRLDPTVAEFPRRSRQQLIERLKQLSVPITGTLGFAKAEVTAGGVSLREVDPRTMASRVADGLFIAGEVLDVDGLIGGYNFQAAFSTGRAAGIAAASMP